MATTFNITFLSPPPSLRPPPTTFIRCGSGPRSGRSPLVKGRILSTEAIHAIQSLKRNSKAKTTPFQPNLSRLIKSDLISILRELLRQGQCSLALHVLSVLRAEYPEHTVDLNLYADVINALVKCGEGESVERVVEEMENERGVRWEEDKGLVRVVKGVVGSGRRDLTVRMWGLMRREGCGDTWTVDEYVGRVLCRGLRSLGEVELSQEVESLLNNF